MNIQNCRITNATVDFTTDGCRTIISLGTISARGEWEGRFILPDEKPQFKFWVSSIMDFAGVHNVSMMKGRIIREVTNLHNEVIGFGDPIKDEFILLGEGQKVQIFTEADLRKEYN